MPGILLAAAPPANPPVDRWASWRWLASPDERVLLAIVAAAALLAVWGLWIGWRRR